METVVSPHHTASEVLLHDLRRRLLSAELHALDDESRRAWLFLIVAGAVLLGGLAAGAVSVAQAFVLLTPRSAALFDAFATLSVLAMCAMGAIMLWFAFATRRELAATRRFALLLRHTEEDVGTSPIS